MAWRRGRSGAADQMIVVGNFSDFSTPNGLIDPSEDVVPMWPPTPRGTWWREIPQDREGPRAGREPIFPWEAKVYGASPPAR